MKWPTREPAFVQRRYDRLAGISPVFERIVLLPRGIRARAVARLELRPGDRGGGAGPRR